MRVVKFSEGYGSSAAPAEEVLPGEFGSAGRTGRRTFTAGEVSSEFVSRSSVPSKTRGAADKGDPGTGTFFFSRGSAFSASGGMSAAGASDPNSTSKRDHPTASPCRRKTMRLPRTLHNHCPDVHSSLRLRQA